MGKPVFLNDAPDRRRYRGVLVIDKDQSSAWR
jgi:hypothetical protein